MEDSISSLSKALSFSCDIVDNIHHDCAPGSSLQPRLDSVEEHDGDVIQLICGHVFDSCNIKVSCMSFFDVNFNPEVD